MVAKPDFAVRIPEAIYNEMVSHITAGYPDEACGALGSKDGISHQELSNRQCCRVSR